jgi:hypothetical protein
MTLIAASQFCRTLDYYHHHHYRYCHHHLQPKIVYQAALTSYWLVVWVGPSALDGRRNLRGADETTTMLHSFPGDNTHIHTYIHKILHQRERGVR